MDRYNINDRFIKLYDELERTNKIGGKGDLATKLGIKASTISEIMGKRQGVTIHFIQKFCEVFPEYVPNDFFFEGGEEVKVEEKDSGDKEKIIKVLENHLEEKDERIKDKDIIIASKEQELSLLKEKVIEYEKKISSRSKNMGNKGHASSSKLSRPPFED